MKVASASQTGLHPTPQLAEAAVRAALDRAGLRRADSVLLFLTRDYARHAPPALLAAVRAAGSMEVAGCTAYGVISEDGWILDQPAAAALVIGDTGNVAPLVAGQSPLLSFSGHHALPHGWQSGPARAGMLDTGALAWAHGRVVADASAETRLPGLRARLAHSTGLRPLSEPLPVDVVNGYDLRQLGGISAFASLQRWLPGELRASPPLHQVVITRHPGTPAVAILAANADGSLTLGEALEPGTQVRWAIRQPLASEEEMRRSLLDIPQEDALPGAVNAEKQPEFAVMFSCLGRGPLYYGNEDRDLLAVREQYPGIPLIGAYGSGQIAPGTGGNHLFQNSVVTLLYESLHV